MINITPFGTKSGLLRVTVRRSNYPQVEVTVGTAAWWALPEPIRALCIPKLADYVRGLADCYLDVKSRCTLVKND